MMLKQTQLVFRFEELDLLSMVSEYSLSEVWEMTLEDATGNLISMIVDHDDDTSPASKEQLAMAESLIDRIELENEKFIFVMRSPSNARWTYGNEQNRPFRGVPNDLCSPLSGYSDRYVRTFKSRGAAIAFATNRGYQITN